MKKLFAALLAFSMAASSMAAVFAADVTPAKPDLQVNVNKDTYSLNLIDIAYGNGRYIAYGKDSDKSHGETYQSFDGGITWSDTANVPGTVKTGCNISGNPQSQQQLVYWKDKDMFVVRSASQSFTLGSKDEKWSSSSTANIHWTTNAMLTTDGKNLIFGGGWNGNSTAANATNSTAKSMFTDNKKDFTTIANYYSKAVAAKPVDENGRTEMFILGQSNAFSLSFTMDDNGKCTWADITDNDKNSGNAFPMYPYDMVYASGADSFLAVDGSEKLFTAKTAKEGVQNLIIKSGVNVTGVNANDQYIVVGMSDGTLYYTENASISANTEWKQLPLIKQSKSEAAIKNIEFSEGNEFVALSDTEVFKGNVENGFYNIMDYNNSDEEPKAEVSTPTFGDTITADDGYWAKTAAFTVKPNGAAVNRIKVTVGDNSQEKDWANLETEVKFGIIVLADEQAKLENIEAVAEAY